MFSKLFHEFDFIVASVFWPRKVATVVAFKHVVNLVVSACCFQLYEQGSVQPLYKVDAIVSTNRAITFASQMSFTPNDIIMTAGLSDQRKSSEMRAQYLEKRQRVTI